MSETNGFQFLGPRADSAYRQFFVKGTKKRALFLYLATQPNEDDPTDIRTPEEVARDFDVPLDAVHEAIRYCESNPIEIRYDARREELLMEAHGMNHPDYPYQPQKYYRTLTLDDRRHISEQLELEFGTL